MGHRPIAFRGPLTPLTWRLPSGGPPGMGHVLRAPGEGGNRPWLAGRWPCLRGVGEGRPPRSTRSERQVRRVNEPWGAGRWPSFRGRLRGSPGGLHGPHLAFGGGPVPNRPRSAPCSPRRGRKGGVGFSPRRRPPRRRPRFVRAEGVPAAGPYPGGARGVPTPEDQVI